AALKWTGLRGEMVYVPQAFWFGGLVGGIIFGFGMVIAGGCGSGSVWRAGEGQIKLMLAVVFFSITVSLVERAIDASKALTALMGNRVFLPHFIGYCWAIISLIAILLLYYVITTWNEKTEKFMVEM
ncbi:MAG: YeeE/YedE family protein, partial [Deltaproteobacteria bacterium CG17_big_fil_post_rev_8_21_14_2_50_51_6]